MAEPPRTQDDAGGSTGERRGRKVRLTEWVEKRAHRVVNKIYEARADEIESRARRAVSSAYEERADDLEERAVRAMRKAITYEIERIKDAIEHGVAVKKREVRLSLVVLVVAALVYLVLFYVTGGAGAGS